MSRRLAPEIFRTWPVNSAGGVLLRIAFLFATWSYSPVVAALNGHPAESEKFREILALHAAPAEFALVLPEPKSEPRASFADSTIYGGGGLIPFLLGALIDTFIESRRDEQRSAQALRYRKQNEEVQQLIRKHSLEDPIIIAKSRVTPSLARALGLQDIRSIEQPLSRSDTSLDALKTAFGPALVVEFGTSSWGIAELESQEWSVFYQAGARVISLRDEQIVAVAACREKAARAPTLALLFENEAALLRAKLSEAAGICADEMLDDLMGALKGVAASAIRLSAAADTTSVARIRRPGFSILPPETDWSVKQTPYGVLFFNVAHSKPGHTLFIWVESLDTKGLKPDTAEAFASHTKALLKKEEDRFRSLEAEVVPYKERDTDCVRFRSVAEERDNPLFPGTVFIESRRGFFCRNPYVPHVALMASYSERRPRDTLSMLDDALTREIDATLATIILETIQ